MDRLAVLRRHLAAAGSPPDTTTTVTASPTAAAGFYRPARGGALPAVNAAAVEAILDGPRGGAMKAAVYEVFRAHPELLVPCTEGLTKGAREWREETAGRCASRACGAWVEGDVGGGGLSLRHASTGPSAFLFDPGTRALGASSCLLTSCGATGIHRVAGSHAQRGSRVTRPPVALPHSSSSFLLSPLSSTPGPRPLHPNDRAGGWVSVKTWRRVKEQERARGQSDSEREERGPGRAATHARADRPRPPSLLFPSLSPRLVRSPPATPQKTHTHDLLPPFLSPRPPPPHPTHTSPGTIPSACLTQTSPPTSI